MKADDRYFMASVAIIRCIKDLERAKEALENKIPLSAASSLRCVIISAAQTMEEIMTLRLSDPSNRISPGCENRCGHTAVHCGREDCKNETASAKIRDDKVSG